MIPVLRPKLPTAEQLLPYLKEVDNNRWYSNFGPLVKRFEAELASVCSVQPENVCTVANGTLGLTVALQALEAPRGALCLMPSWTFLATPAAALAAGLRPCFIDVDKNTMTITPEIARKAVEECDGPVGAVIPVASFGTPLDIAAWDRFTEETGITVIIDGAAAFDALASGCMKPGITPVMVSLHATKAFGVGEGGFIISSNPDTIFKIQRISNFGFENDRRSHRIAINAKMSEYSAAVGLAALHSWKDTRNAWSRVRNSYRNLLDKVGVRTWIDERWVASTCNVIVPEMASALMQQMEAMQIQTRRWWTSGCHAMPAYRACTSVGSLPNTQWFGQSLLGMPCSVDITDEEITKVCDSLSQCIEAIESSRKSAV